MGNLIEGRFFRQPTPYEFSTTSGALALAEPVPTRPQLKLVQDVPSRGTPVDDLSLRRRRRRDGSSTFQPLVENSRQSVIESDLHELADLQRQFDAALGRTYDPQDLLHRSYNPVIDVLHVRQLRRNGDEGKERAHRQEITLNMETNLRERYKVSKSTIDYHIDGGKLFSQHFPHEPFDDVLARGVEYRLQHNTPEPEREGMLGEQGGWKKIQDKFTDPKTKIGTKMTAFSPPGLVENTAYTGKFVDEYELAENEKGERYVKLTRYAVKFDEQGYLNAALSLDPKYFDGYDGRPLDAWMLSHPVEGPLQLPDSDIDVKKDFVPDLTSGKLLSFLNFYDDALREEPVDWVKIALAFNAIVNQSDEEKDANDQGRKFPSSLDMPISAGAIQQEINTKGRQEVVTVVGGGCPANRGFSLAGGNRLEVPSNISVKEPGTAQFSASHIGERTLHCKSCPQCGARDIDARIVGGMIICPVNGCSAPYSC